MNYIKLYESFKLSKYESDYLRYNKREEDYYKKKREMLEIRSDLDQMDLEIRDDNKLDKMLEHILDKLSKYYLEESDYEIGDDILKYLPKSIPTNLGLCEPINYRASGVDFSGTIENIIISELYNEWTFYITDDSEHEISDLPVNNIYEIIQVLMNDIKVSGILNIDIFKKINK